MARLSLSALLLLATSSSAAAEESDVTALLQTGAELKDSQYPLIRTGYSSGHAEFQDMPGRRHRINTPEYGGQCGFAVVGNPVPPRQAQLLNCSTNLPVGIPDMRGDWTGMQKLYPFMKPDSAAQTNQYWGQQHIEHIEQCEDRVIIVTDRIVRDFTHADGTFERGVQDFNEQMLPACVEYVAAGEFDGAGCFVITPESDKARKTKRCLTPEGVMIIEDGSAATAVHLELKRVALPTDLVPHVFNQPTALPNPQPQVHNEFRDPRLDDYGGLAHRRFNQESATRATQTEEVKESIPKKSLHRLKSLVGGWRRNGKASLLETSRACAEVDNMPDCEAAGCTWNTDNEDPGNEHCA